MHCGNCASDDAAMGTLSFISPWNPFDRLKSPDGAHTAVYKEWGEIAMGGPISGSLVLPGGRRIDGCNCSVVWSDDSRCIAIPCWTEHRQQRLLIVDIQERRFCYAEGIYSVLELHSFRDGIVQGIDSPIHRPEEVRIDTRLLHWRDGFGSAVPDAPAQHPEPNAKGCLALVVLIIVAVLVV